MASPYAYAARLKKAHTIAATYRRICVDLLKSLSDAEWDALTTKAQTHKASTDTRKLVIQLLSEEAGETKEEGVPNVSD